MNIKPRRNTLYPVMIVLLVSLALVFVSIANGDGDPLALARIGTRYSQGDSNGSDGYDGQFVYFIAVNPDPTKVEPYLDVPAYRYQRILLPILARIMSMGNLDLLPWMIVLIGVLSMAFGSWAASELLFRWGVSSWYALIYGLWVGFLLALITDLPEPLAFGLVVLGVLAIERSRPLLGVSLWGLSVFAKEVTLIFVFAGLLFYLYEHRWKEAFLTMLIGILPYAIFQLWLWSVFGQPGLGSGGAMATPFEWIPFRGLLQIGSYSLLYLFGMLAVFGPTVVFPVLWGIWSSVKSWLSNERSLFVICLFFNALIIVFSPFSTFRETGGILRFTSGLVLAVLLFAGRYQMRRALNYSLFWLVLNVFLLKPGGPS